MNSKKLVARTYLEYNSNWLIFYVELDLLSQYSYWADVNNLRDGPGESEKSFYEALGQDLAHDWRATSHEHWESMI